MKYPLLLGKHDFFIRDTENPFRTTLIDSEDTSLGKVVDGVVQLSEIGEVV